MFHVITDAPHVGVGVSLLGEYEVPGEAEKVPSVTANIRLGGDVRFHVGLAPEAMKGRESDLGVVVAFDARGGPEARLVVQFDGHRSAALQPGMLNVVGEVWSRRDDPEMAD